MRILCISPLFVPVENSESVTGAKMVEALVRSGTDVTVLASYDLTYGGLANHKSPWWKPLNAVTVNIPQLRNREPLRSMITAVRFKTPFFARWVARAVTVARQLHESKNFDLVYSRSLPMIAHVAAFWCAQTLNLPWAANINDPWELNFFPSTKTDPLPAFVRHAYVYWLRTTLQNADLVTYPCKGLHEFHTRLSGMDHAAAIIPHIGYRSRKLAPDSENEFRIVHAGKLGTNELTGRSAKALLLGLRAFLDTWPDAAALTRLLLVGPEDRQTEALIHELRLTPNVDQTGKVDYESSIDQIQSASICVLIEANVDESIFFPSKLADYIVCAKPVLALSPPIGIASDLANRGEILRIDHNPEAVQKALTTLYQEFKCNKLQNRKPTAALTAQFDGHHVAQQFLKACHSRLEARDGVAFQAANH